MHVPDTGPEELQLVMECAELEASTAEYSNWDALELALLSCPYPALVEFNTRHGRTLLTLAERSLEAAAAAAELPDIGSTNTSSSRQRRRAARAAAAAQEPALEAAAGLASCLACCMCGTQPAGSGAAGFVSF